MPNFINQILEDEMKKISWITVLLVFLFSLTGCTAIQDMFRKDVLDGVVGQTYNTKWFDFTINEITTAEVYNEYLPPDESYQFVVVNITEENTFGEALSMSCWDFKLEAEGMKESDEYAREDFKDDPKVMPTSFELAPGSSVEYQLVFCVPKEIHDISLVYLEIDEDNKAGSTYQVNYTLPE
jgi:hypothetical protein